MDVADLMNQSATYWPPSGNDGFGSLTYGSPVLIACRWQDVQKLFRDANGREVMSEAIVYPDRDVAAAGRIALGDQTATADPLQVSGSKEIRQTGLSPSLDADASLRKVWL